MQEPMSITMVIISGAGLLFLLYLWLVLCRDYRIDSLRQNLFDIRAQLFDTARAGVIQFDDPLYGMLRSELNGFIRHANRLECFGLLLFTFSTMGSDYAKAESERQLQLKKELLHDRTPEVRRQLESLESRMHRTVFNYLLFSPGMLAFVLAPLAVVTLGLGLILVVLAIALLVVASPWLLLQKRLPHKLWVIQEEQRSKHRELLDASLRHPFDRKIELAAIALSEAEAA